MPRTKSDTVEYFPHFANSSSEGATIKVLQSRYGNDGYAFWFKLLEKLASTDGHYLDCRNPRRWQVLLADVGVDNETGVEIMNLLVEMEAIDKELWQQGIIWCQNLVDNVAHVYKNRKREIPEKPITTGNNGITTNRKAITNSNLLVEIPQRRGEGRRGKESILTTSSSEFQESEFNEYIDELRAEFSDVDFENELKKFDLYWSEGGRKLKRPKLALRNWMEKAREIGKGKHEPPGQEFETITNFALDKKAEGLWGKALKELAGQMTEPNYRTWLSKTRAIRYENNVFVVGVPNFSNAEYLNKNQRGLIEKAVIGVAGKKLRVVFAVVPS